VGELMLDQDQHK